MPVARLGTQLDIYITEESLASAQPVEEQESYPDWDDHTSDYAQPTLSRVSKSPALAIIEDDVINVDTEYDSDCILTHVSEGEDEGCVISSDDDLEASMREIDTSFML